MLSPPPTQASAVASAVAVVAPADAETVNTTEVKVGSTMDAWQNSLTYQQIAEDRRERFQAYEVVLDEYFTRIDSAIAKTGKNLAQLTLLEFEELVWDVNEQMQGNNREWLTEANSLVQYGRGFSPAERAEIGDVTNTHWVRIHRHPDVKLQSHQPWGSTNIDKFFQGAGYTHRDVQMLQFNLPQNQEQTEREKYGQLTLAELAAAGLLAEESNRGFLGDALAKQLENGQSAEIE